MNRATPAVTSLLLQPSRRALYQSVSKIYKPYPITASFWQNKNKNNNNFAAISNRSFSNNTDLYNMSSSKNAKKNCNPYSKYIQLAEKACEFLTASPDPFHVVHNCVSKLETYGYTKLNGSQPFSGHVIPGGKYYYIVGNTTLVAFCVGPKLDVKKKPFGFHIVAGHTDSPNLRIKPRSKRSAVGCTQLAVECYGGGIWQTWFDRDLSICGRVLLQESQQKSGAGRSFLKTKQRLVNLEDPIARISTLAIHMQSGEERKCFSVNKENHTAPIIAIKNGDDGGIGSQSNKTAGKVLEQEASDQINSLSKWQESQ